MRVRAWRALAVTLRRDGAEDERSLGEAVLVCCASRCGLVSRHRKLSQAKVKSIQAIAKSTVTFSRNNFSGEFTNYWYEILIGPGHTREQAFGETA